MMVNPALREEQKPPPIDKISQRAAGIISKKTGSPESVWTGPAIRALGASNCHQPRSRYVLYPGTYVRSECSDEQAQKAV